MSTQPKSLKDRLNALAGNKPGAGKPVQTPKPEIDKLKKEPGTGKGRNYVPKGLGLGGAREGSGRPPSGIALERRQAKKILSEHVAEEVEVKVLDKITGKERILKKSRILIQLERLFQSSVNKDGTFNDGAIDKWLNRALGKAPQPLIGDEDEDPVRVNLGVEQILDKAYGDDDER